MKRSRYTVLVPNYPSPAEHLLYNTRTQALVVIPEAVRVALDRLPEPSARSARKPLRQLRKMGFLVQDDARDRANLDAYFRDIKAGPQAVNATVLTTFACNFACTYCVEEGVTAAVHMDEPTAIQAAAYIVAQARKRRSRAVYVSLYGGEPLLNLKAVRTVLRETKARAEEFGLEFGASMTTNGALLTPGVVDELAELGLQGVKVTVDGDRAHHDAKRPFKGGSGSFDLIMQNVEYASGRVDVDLGGNFDQENAESFPALLDYLEGKGIAGRLNRVSFKPISGTPADRERARTSAELQCVYARSETAATTVRLRQEVVRRGLATDPHLGVQICGITLDGAHFTIDPRGVLYRCPAFVGHTEFSTGDIRSGETRAPVDLDLWKRCADCAYAPMCGDGCMFSAYIRYGDANQLNCQREYVEFVVRENLKTQYEEDTRDPRTVGDPAA
jgi:uncharacterized protein